MSQDGGTKYGVRITPDGGEVVQLWLHFPSTPADTFSAEHPVDLLGPAFRASLEDAAKAFIDPNVTEVPVYRAGELDPIAYVKRLP